jgi:hypothetical protein
MFTEMIRDGREDEYWLLKMIFLHGNDNPFVSNWFVKQGRISYLAGQML